MIHSIQAESILLELYKICKIFKIYYMVYKITIDMQQASTVPFNLHQIEFPYLEIIILTLISTQSKSRGSRNITFNNNKFFFQSPSGCTRNTFNNINNFINHLTSNSILQQLLQPQQFKQSYYGTTCAL